jgi:hypothetical protein
MFIISFFNSTLNKFPGTILNMQETFWLKNIIIVKLTAYMTILKYFDSLVQDF